MELIRGPKPLTEIERAFAAEKYKQVKAELSVAAITAQQERDGELWYPSIREALATGFAPEGFLLIKPCSGRAYIRRRQNTRLGDRIYRV